MQKILVSLCAAAILSANVSFGAKDGVLSDSELYRGALYAVALGKGKAKAATEKIIAAYSPQSVYFKNNLDPYIEFAAKEPINVPYHQSLYEGMQGVITLAYALQTFRGPGAGNNAWGWAAHDTIDPIYAYLRSEHVRTRPDIIAAFDAEHCTGNTDDPACIEPQINDQFAFFAQGLMWVFPFFQEFQIAPEAGGTLKGDFDTDIFILRGNTTISDSGGMDAYAIGWACDVVIDGFDEDDFLVFPSAFFGGTLADIASHLSAAADTPEGLHFEFYDGAVRITLRNVHSIGALQIIAF